MTWTCCSTITGASTVTKGLRPGVKRPCAKAATERLRQNRSLEFTGINYRSFDPRHGVSGESRVGRAKANSESGRPIPRPKRRTRLTAAYQLSVPRRRVSAQGALRDLHR